MDERKKTLEGSPNRDKFKRLHKQLSPQFYACDLDFVFVEKEPVPDIVLVLDYKMPGDGITFSETIMYCTLVRRGIADAGTFIIQEFIGGHHGKPRCMLRDEASTNTWAEFEQWERDKRNKWKKRYCP